MYSKPMLGLSQCRAAIDAMIADFNNDPNRRPVDMAIVDDMGNLLAYARMDGCHRPTFAISKAYTSAIRRMDTVAFADQLKTQARNLADFGDPQLVIIQGGLVIETGDERLLGGALVLVGFHRGRMTRTSRGRALRLWVSYRPPKAILWRRAEPEGDVAGCPPLTHVHTIQQKELK